MKRPQFFEDLDRSLAGEDVEPAKDAAPVEVQVSTTTRQYRDMQAADVEALQMAEYARLMRQASVRVSLDMACVSSNQPSSYMLLEQMERQR